MWRGYATEFEVVVERSSREKVGYVAKLLMQNVKEVHDAKAE